MKTLKLFFAAAITLICFNSCGPLLPASITKIENVEDYKFFCMEDTKELTSSSGSVFNNGTPYGTFGTNVSKSVNPSDVISGYLIKKGFIRLPNINPELADNTLIVNYGESGKRGTGLGGYTIEVTIQFVSVKTHNVICTCSAEGQGETEADDIRIAIKRCLDTVFGIQEY